MLIAMPVDGNIVSSGVCISFGRTPFFLIYNSLDESYTFVENTAASAQGGAGIKAAQILVDKKIDVLITPRCGQNAADVINGGNIKIYKSISNSINDNLTEFKNGRLSVLTDIHEGLHHHGGR